MALSHCCLSAAAHQSNELSAPAGMAGQLTARCLDTPFRRAAPRRAVVLAIVGFVAGRMWQARHRRQTTVAAAPPGAAAGGGGKDSMDLEAGWVQQSSQAKVQQSSQATDLDSAAPSPCDPSSTAGTQQASPDGQQGLADLWAQAVLGAAPPPAAQGSPAGTASDAGVQPHDSAFYARAQRQSGRSGGVPSPAASTASDAAVPDSPATGLRRIASRRSTSVLTGSPSTAMGLDRWEVDFSALTLVRTLGEGSAGKVRKPHLRQALWCHFGVVAVSAPRRAGLLHRFAPAACHPTPPLGTTHASCQGRSPRTNPAGVPWYTERDQRGSQGAY